MKNHLGTFKKKSFGLINYNVKLKNRRIAVDDQISGLKFPTDFFTIFFLNFKVNLKEYFWTIL